MPEQPIQSTQRKREIAYKLRIGDILKATPITEQHTYEGQTRERLKFLEIDEQNKKVVRANITANIIDKFISEGEKRFATLTVDDASGQIRIKVFGDDVKQFEELNQGDTLLIIGMLRSFNNEIYIAPEIIKKIDPRYLLVRKLEIEANQPKQASPEAQAKTLEVKDQIIELIKAGESEGGIDTEQIILKLNTVNPDTINQEITKLLEQGAIYEPRPGRVRYLG